MITTVGRTELSLIIGDITEQATDAIVNAANTMLKLGGGVAGAIRAKGGPEIQAECDRQAPILAGEAAITTGGRLKARYVIHAAGPMMGEGDEERKLRNAILNSLRLADKNNLKSITFPAISTGIFGYPIAPASRTILSAAIEYMTTGTDLENVVFALYAAKDYAVFEKTFKELLEL